MLRCLGFRCLGFCFFLGLFSLRFRVQDLRVDGSGLRRVRDFGVP